MRRQTEAQKIEADKRRALRVIQKTMHQQCAGVKAQSRKNSLNIQVLLRAVDKLQPGIIDAVRNEIAVERNPLYRLVGEDSDNSNQP